MRKGDTLEESKTYPGAWMWTSLRVTGRGIAKKPWFLFLSLSIRKEKLILLLGL